MEGDTSSEPASGMRLGIPWPPKGALGFPSLVPANSPCSEGEELRWGPEGGEG